MAQGDINIANQGFPAFRADLNNQLEALVTNSSGATAPTTPFPHQWWLDTSTTPNTLKQRNAANDAWISVALFDQSNNTFNLLVGAGTVTAPSITTTGDTNTGIYFPAADTIGFTEGGVERLRITSAGNVGIGTTSPGTELELNGTANATNLTRGGSQVYSRDNILGTVSESSGVPTGAIIQRGSNANGEFALFADGTVVQSRTLDLGAAFYSSWSSLAYTYTGTDSEGVISSGEIPVPFSYPSGTRINAVSSWSTTNYWGEDANIFSAMKDGLKVIHDPTVGGNRWRVFGPGAFTPSRTSTRITFFSYGRWF